MTKILFICHGNICRSPMAEFVMKDLVRKAGLEMCIRDRLLMRPMKFWMMMHVVIRWQM